MGAVRLLEEAVNRGRVRVVARRIDRAESVALSDQIGRVAAIWAASEALLVKKWLPSTLSKNRKIVSVVIGVAA